MNERALKNVRNAAKIVSEMDEFAMRGLTKGLLGRKKGEAHDRHQANGVPKATKMG